MTLLAECNTCNESASNAQECNKDVTRTHYVRMYVCMCKCAGAILTMQCRGHPRSECRPYSI